MNAECWGFLSESSRFLPPLRPLPPVICMALFVRGQPLLINVRCNRAWSGHSYLFACVCVFYRSYVEQLGTFSWKFIFTAVSFHLFRREEEDCFGLVRMSPYKDSGRHVQDHVPSIAKRTFLKMQFSGMSDGHSPTSANHFSMLDLSKYVQCDSQTALCSL